MSISDMGVERPVDSPSPVVGVARGVIAGGVAGTARGVGARCGGNALGPFFGGLPRFRFGGSSVPGVSVGVGVCAGVLRGVDTTDDPIDPASCASEDRLKRIGLIWSLGSGVRAGVLSSLELSSSLSDLGGGGGRGATAARLSLSLIGIDSDQC
jgi:hypothetical protein